jgi:hypothetical protein
VERKSDFASCEISDTATVKCGVSERGIGIQAVVLMRGAKEFEGATVYMTVEEARQLRDALDAAIPNG